jgi:hypothetical protein
MKTVIFFVAISVSTGCQAGIGKWLRNEVAPTLAGKRPLKIDPNRISIVHNGKPILKYEGDSLYIRAGDVKFKTSHLRQSIAEAGAIFAGDTTVLSKVLAEQFSQKLAAAEKAGEIIVSDTPPPLVTDSTKTSQSSGCAGKMVALFNQTPVAIRYALNDETFELRSGSGNRHCDHEGKFFLQFDEDISEQTHIARYFLAGNTYGLALSPENSTIEIVRHN